IVDVIHATREPRNYGLAELAPLVEYGASPRASIYLAMAARAHAFLRHRGYVSPEDVKAVGQDILRHRIVLTYEAEEVLSARRVVGQIYIDDKIRDYIVELVQATRDPRAYGLHLLAPLVEFGGSPRATIYLAQAARAHAFLRHRGYVTPEDVKAIGADVLRHRIVLTYEAEAEEVSTEDVIRRVFEHIEVP
ncbi:MAG TPA: hypothetical protein VL172_07060, partial [Kofleriaceae bacterium]|nr:hypothetical protein [Kofleriaceae bacterium]